MNIGEMVERGERGSAGISRLHLASKRASKIQTRGRTFTRRRELAYLFSGRGAIRSVDARVAMATRFASRDVASN